MEMGFYYLEAIGNKTSFDDVRQIQKKELYHGFYSCARAGITQSSNQSWNRLGCYQADVSSSLSA